MEDGRFHSRLFSEKIEDMGIEEAVTTAKGISDFGMMAITAAFFLILSAWIMIACFKWFKSIINTIIKDNKGTMLELLEETRAQNSMLASMTEGLRPETQLRIKNISGAYFDLAKYHVLEIIKRVRKENHIVDHEATAKKIRGLLHNIYEDRNSRFDSFTYRGKKLSTYTSPEWVDKVAFVVEGEIYNESGPNDSRAYTNVSSVYDDIKIDFYHRLNNE